MNNNKEYWEYWEQKIKERLEVNFNGKEKEL